MQNIYLVGFMATGKTHIGKELAKKIKWHFIDLDDLIELRERRRIRDIFARDGEPYFRRLETRALNEVAKEKQFVVACGGGIVLNPDNIKTMKATGMMIGLAASVAVILKRAQASGDRPLLNVPDPKKRVELLLKLRAPYYAQADKTIDTSRLSPAQVVAKIVPVTKTGKKRGSKK